MRTSASISVQYDNIFSPFAGADWETGFRWVKQQGFDGVELILADPNLLDVDKIGAALTRYELPAATISTGQAMGMEGLSMCSASEQVRNATWKRIKDDIDFSVAIGRPNVTIGLIRGVGGVLSADLEYDFLLRQMHLVADYAEKMDVMINFEPINRYECKRINSTAAGKKLLDDLGNPSHVGILYDTFHSNIEDPDPIQAILNNAPFISHVHLADSNRRLPGEGHIDFVKTLQTLQDAGFTGFTSLEVLNVPDCDHIRQFAGKQIKKIYGGINHA